ncbi:MAG: hypothetical protein H6667_06435 [Ardenticatenaceae bacterium]|nr:hypothetical protein [Ardenticatenaceae bacterium]MCB9442818.1 hypothetical protein [Ardenticatenaceae bacterium]
MMVHELLTQLNRSGIVIRLKEDGNLAVTAPKGAMTAEIAGQIKTHKNEIVTFLSTGAENGSARSFSPIIPVERSEYLPVSLAQERLWWVEQLAPGTAVYNLPFAFHLNGSLDIAALERSLQWTIQRHEVLRIQFRAVDGKPKAQLIDNLPEAIPVVALDTLPENEREEKLHQLLQDHTQIPFDLENGPLFRTTLFRLAPDEHVLLFLVHHIIFDGWSAEVLWQDLATAYKVDDPDVARPPMSIQYADYAAWRREWLNSKAATADRDFWQKQLQGPVDALILPVSRTLNSHQAYYEAHQQQFRIPAALTAQIKMLAKQEKATPFMVLLAAYKATLHAYSGQNDMIVCSPIMGRMLPDLDNLIGYFNNIVVLRTSLAQEPNFIELLSRVRQTVLAANEHQTIPFQQIAELPDVSNVSLMRALFVLQDSAQTLESIPGITSTPVSVQRNFDYADMSIEFFETNNGMTGTLWFKTALFDLEVMQHFIENFLTTLSNVVNNPILSLSKLARFAMPVVEVKNSNGSTKAVQQERPFTPPRNEIESQLAIIWGNLLNYEPVSVHDDFFEVGGHSLLAIRFFDQIEEINNKKLPLALLFEAPTIAELANIIQDDTWEATTSSIVAISGSKHEQQAAQRPFYCIIPPGDELLIFNDLAKEMGDERPFLGLQYGVNGETPITSVEEMAAYFIEQITTIDDSEPFLIGGYCFGGLIAYEMARQLAAQDRRVDLVVLIDTNVPGSVWARQNNVQNILRERINGFRRNGLRKELAYIFDRVSDIWKLQIWQPIWIKLHKFYAQTKREWPDFLRNFDLINHNAAEKYQVKPYDGSVILLQAKERLEFYEYSPHLGWETFVQKDFTDHFVPGDHEQLLRNPNAKVLAEKITSALTAVTLPPFTA